MLARYSPYLVLFLTLGLLGACAKKEESPARPAEFKAWGKDFVINPIETADEKSKQLSKAVVQVRYATGGSGTGFFVSPDGLLLTNHHVLSDEMCSESHCGGVLLIRDFAPNGELQVFTRFKVLLHSEELDFALVKVELPENQTVPYLHLKRTSLSSDRLEDARLTAIGHPAGASLRSTPLDYGGLSNGVIHTMGPIFWGNSGSPLIDLNTSEVVGIVTSIQVLSPSSINREGQMSISNQAVAIDAVLSAIRLVYADADHPLRGTQFTNAQLQATDTLKKVLLPKTNAEYEAEKKEMTVSAFVGRYMGTADEDAVLAKLMSTVGESLRKVPTLNGLLQVLQRISLTTGRLLTLKEVQVDEFTKVLEAAAQKEPTSADAIERMKRFLNRFTGRISEKECLNHADFNESSYLGLLSCQAVRNAQGVDVLDDVFEIAENLNSKNQPRYQVGLGLLYEAISDRVLVEKPTDAQRAEILKILSRVSREAGNVGLSFKAEALHTILNRKPSLATAGAYADTL